MAKQKFLPTVITSIPLIRNPAYYFLLQISFDSFSNCILKNHSEQRWIANHFQNICFSTLLFTLAEKTRLLQAKSLDGDGWKHADQLLSKGRCGDGRRELIHVGNERDRNTNSVNWNQRQEQLPRAAVDVWRNASTALLCFASEN